MAYTSYKTRKALGRRYSVDPALLLEIERLQREYAAAPGREARALQAAQFDKSLSVNESQFDKSLAAKEAQFDKSLSVNESQFDKSLAAKEAQLDKSLAANESQFAQNLATTKSQFAQNLDYKTSTDAKDRAERADAAEQAQISGMVGTAGNLLSTAGTIRALQVANSGQPFFGSMGTKIGGLFSSGAATTSTAAGLGATSAASATGSAAGAAASGYGGIGGAGATAAAPTTSGIVGGTAAVAAKVVPYYAAAKLAGGAIMNNTEEGTILYKVGESLNRPLNATQYWVKEVVGDVPIVNTVLDVLNPLAPAERVISDAVGTVICTELYRQGIMPDDIFEADKAFGVAVEPETMAGYHLWGIPAANLMKRSKLFTWAIKPFGMAWANHMAGNENILGAVLMKIGIPVCNFLGRSISRKVEVTHA